MGCNFFEKLAAWTTILVLVLCEVNAFDHGLLGDLGLSTLPDISKINISLDEYTNMMTNYLQIRRNSIDSMDDDVPELMVFNLDSNLQRQRKQKSVKMKFKVNPASADVEVESATLRILAPPQPNASIIITVRVNQILGARRRHLLDERTVYLSKNSSKWCEFDVSSAVKSWVAAEKNLGLELTCTDCKNNLFPERAALTALVHNERKRSRRSPNFPNERRKTDCRNTNNRGKKKRCCRHDMEVTFSKLPFPEMDLILEPSRYDAGFCHGVCPINYHYATNHSRIQGLMHQMERREAKLENRKGTVPKACCTPSKLGPLEILLIDKNDPTKLMVQKWDNMRVIECACS